MIQKKYNTFYKTSGQALINSMKYAEENLVKDIKTQTNEQNVKKKKIK